MSPTTVLLPGDAIESTSLPSSQKRRIGPGIKELPSTIDSTSIATIAGPLDVDFRRKSARISTPNARYTPRPGDLIIAQVRSGSQDFFFLHINPHSQQAILPYLAFEGATKKTRPQLKSGDLVYAKVISAVKNMEVEVSCVNPSTGKSEPDGLGPLTGGMMFSVSLGLAERLMKKDGVNVLMEELGTKISGGFEIAVGKNGKVWVDCPELGTKGVVAVGRCLREVDERGLGEKDQKKVVTRIVNEVLGGG